MAIYHFTVSTISRGKGQSIVRVAAARAGERIRDERIGQTHNFLKRKGIEHRRIFTPAGAPAWMSDRTRLWNAIERSERRINSQLAREIQVALPNELSGDGQISLLERFILEQFVSRGMVADVVVNRGNPKNHHATILLTTRVVQLDGFGQKDRSWNSRALLLMWREAWAKVVNKELEREGFSQRIDHRSNADRGIALEPQSKIGIPKAEFETEGRDFIQDRIREHEELSARNAKSILENPAIVLETLAKEHRSFSPELIEGFVMSRVGTEASAKACVEAVMSLDWKAYFSNG